MKKLIAGMLIMASIRTMGCDLCGFYLGIQPHDRTTSFGLIYRYRLLDGVLSMPETSGMTHGGHATTSTAAQHYRELYQALEFRADMWLTERFSALVSLPVVNNYQSVNGIPTADVYGVSDPLLILRYMVLNTKCLTLHERTVHRLTLGSGVKFPIGRNDMPYNGEVVDHDLQPSTGSWDYFATVEYMVRHHNIGASLNATGRLNGTAPDGYHFGNSVSGTAELFYSMQFTDLTWVPSAGVCAETQAEDEVNGVVMPGMGYSTVFASAGSRVWWHSWSVSATYQYAVMNSTGDMMVPNKDRLILGISYLLTNNND